MGKDLLQATILCAAASVILTSQTQYILTACLLYTSKTNMNRGQPGQESELQQPGLCRDTVSKTKQNKKRLK